MIVLFLHGGMDNYIGSFHPILVHFPIVLFVLTLICDLIYGCGKVNGFFVGRWMLFGGTLMCIPTIATGWEASESFPPQDPLVFKHMIFAFSTFSYALIYSCFSLIVLHKNWNIHPIIFVALSLGLVSLTSWTSNYGGLLSHGQTPFSQVKARDES